MIYDEFKKLSPEAKQYIFLNELIEKNINFNDLHKQYIKFLEIENNKLIRSLCYSKDIAGWFIWKNLSKILTREDDFMIARFIALFEKNYLDDGMIIKLIKMYNISEKELNKERLFIKENVENGDSP